MRMEMILAGLNAFKDIESMQYVTAEQAAVGAAELIMNLAVHSSQLGCLATLATNEPEGESTRTALARHIIQQVSNLAMSPVNLSEKVIETVSGYLV